MKIVKSLAPPLMAVAIACALASPALSLDYPTRPVRLVVGFPAGGSADIVARIVGQALTERMGQSFVIDNKPGAGSNLGTDLVVACRAPTVTTLMAESVVERHQSDALQEAHLRSGSKTLSRSRASTWCRT